MASVRIIAEEFFAKLEKKEEVINDFIDEIDNFSSFFRTDKKILMREIMNCLSH